MSRKDAYKQKVEAEVELAEAKLAEIKAKAKGYTADVGIKYGKQIDDLEDNVERMRSKLQKMRGANDDAWEHLKSEIEDAWETLQVGLRNISAKLKE